MSMERIYFNQIENLKEIMHGSKLKIKLLQRLLGFTLAEVLITLGIIGIVATITIPIINNEAQEAQYTTALKRVYSDLSQAMVTMQASDSPYTILINDTNLANRLANEAKKNVLHFYSWENIKVQASNSILHLLTN